MKYVSYIKGGVIYRYRSHFFPGHRTKCKDDFKNSKLNTPDKVSDYISALLDSTAPCMISRYGSTELTCAVNYGKGVHPLWRLRNIYPFWISQSVKQYMKNYSGFFPLDDSLLSKFSDLLIDSAKCVDVLGSWLYMEKVFEPKMSYEKCPLLYLEPYWSKQPWTASIKGKKVLVVHPFAETIERQYQKRSLLFENTEVLPEFGSLKVIKAVQSLGGG